MNKKLVIIGSSLMIAGGIMIAACGGSNSSSGVNSAIEQNRIHLYCADLNTLETDVATGQGDTYTNGQHLAADALVLGGRWLSDTKAMIPLMQEDSPTWHAKADSDCGWN